MAARTGAKILEEFPRLLQLSKPNLVNGVWHKPEISARQFAMMRKTVVLDGLAWPLDEEEAKRRVERRVRPIKGRKADLEKPARMERIAKLMEQMPELVQKHKKTQRDMRRTKKQEEMEKRA